ncbi:MAG: short-chain dehydrogenase/reductase [Phenylobacterium sp.]|nr:short-chain dehydrogenase/reductase [Phenylobacterium sp.]
MSEAFANLPPIADGGVAVITGGASGIGLAAARRFATLGMPVVLADLSGERLRAAETAIRDSGGRVAAVPTDVSKPQDLERLRDLALRQFGHVGVLMLNAGIGLNPGGTWKNLDAWRTLVDVNLWGAIHGVQAFLPAMIEARRPAFVVATGSKQGITTPPGNAAYNVSKAALKAFTEALQHELRNTPDSRISAHLLIPGFTYTGLTATRIAEKPPGAWTPEQVVEFMLESLDRGDFYVLCPDNDVPREIDERRVQWSAGDIIENRPALSRWHPDFKAAFEAFMAKGRH